MHQIERTLCRRCLKSTITCYCGRLRPVRARHEVVVLQHPLEYRKAIGTGRMAHLILEKSRFILGAEFGDHPAVNALIEDPGNDSVVLYPGSGSRNLSLESAADLRELFDAEKNGVIFLLDGTWSCAKKMLARSPNLARLPRICFTPERRSEYAIRRQPDSHCLSTIEAIHKVLSILEPSLDASPLLEVFREMVLQQEGYARARRNAIMASDS